MIALEEVDSFQHIINVIFVFQNFWLLGKSGEDGTSCSGFAVRI